MRAETLGEVAHIAVIEQDFSRAKQLAQDSLKLCKERAHRSGMIEPLTVLGEAALGLGDYQAAETYFRKALQAVTEAWVPSYGLHALVGMTKLLAAVGKKERALELAIFISQHPGSWQWSKDSIAPSAAELEAELSPDVVEAVRMRVKEKKLEGVLEELIIRDIRDPDG